LLRERWGRVIVAFMFEPDPIARPGPTPLASPNRTESSLPAPLTPLLGRETNVVTICALIDRDDVPLVTLTGPGGVGKTRLATEVATRLVDVFPDGVRFVELASITDPAYVVSTVAHVFGLADSADMPLEARLKTFLGGKWLLLVLDNFEHVIDAALFVAHLIAACPNLKILVTSREPLKIAAEREYLVPPLGLPDHSIQQTAELLEASDAVRLFVTRARAVEQSFDLTTDNAQVVADICRRVDGLPLAIELAAARIKVLPPAALLARLDQPLAILTGSRRDAHPRQQTMRNTIAWSYELLSPEDQHVFRAAGVFAGSFSLDAALDVAGSGDEADLEVFESVASLVDKNMLHAVAVRDGNARFLMLETVREYALECLKAAGEEGRVRTRHATYFTELTERESERWLGAGNLLAITGANSDYGNILGALEWLDRGSDSDEFLRLAAALIVPWIAQGRVGTGRQWLERALSAHPDASVFARASASNAAGLVSIFQGDYASAETHFRTSLDLWKQTPPNGGRWSGGPEGETPPGRGRWRKARERDQYRRHEARTLSCYGFLAFRLGDHQQARQRTEDALAVFERLGAELVEHHADLADTYSLLGDIYADAGDLEIATESYLKAISIEREHGIVWLLCETLPGLGVVLLNNGEIEQADQLYRESLSIATEYGDTVRTARALIGLAAVAISRRQATLAARFVGAADAHLEVAGTVMFRRDEAVYEGTVARARQFLGGDQFEEERRIGRTAPLADIIAEMHSPSVPESPVLSVPDGDPACTLSPREREILARIADGQTNQEIATDLDLSIRTVNNHVTAILEKLGQPSRAAAVAIAIRHRLI
jgi:predicted ATPase/DNA-binding NarL/FixJ family response regulator